MLSALARMPEKRTRDASVKSCQSCGEQYLGPVHNCGYVSVRRDRLRELEAIERGIRTRGSSQVFDAKVARRQ